eukprot:TRINITY_DN2905_c0_g1_i7.p1 TRINITY_DN2905_c0_g1~~TRINITY_DN2905_c0_g1_i7.p1  ORF type:complete len:183 (-),score=29.35 TRINITY_DN2905_c0_g1_i7:43-591(-)
MLINNGAGGVGNFAIQVAKHFGLKVFTTCSTKNIDYVKKLGADYVIDYTKDDIISKVKELTNGVGLDYWCDSLSGEGASMGLDCLGFRGELIIMAGSPSNESIKNNLHKNISLHWIFLGLHYTASLEIQRDIKVFGDSLGKLYEDGKLILPDITTINMKEVPSALGEIKKGHVRGKIVAKAW